MATFTRAAFDATVFDVDDFAIALFTRPKFIDIEVDDPDIDITYELSSRDWSPTVELLDEHIEVAVPAPIPAPTVELLEDVVSIDVGA